MRPWLWKASLIKAVEDFGTIDICIANAGMSAFSPLIEQDLEVILKVMQTNAVGVVASAQAVVPGMISKGRGVLVVIGSVSGAMITPYAVSLSNPTSPPWMRCTSFTVHPILREHTVLARLQLPQYATRCEWN